MEGHAAILGRPALAVGGGAGNAGQEGEERFDGAGLSLRPLLLAGGCGRSPGLVVVYAVEG